MIPGYNTLKEFSLEVGIPYATVKNQTPNKRIP